MAPGRGVERFGEGLPIERLLREIDRVEPHDVLLLPVVEELELIGL